MAKYRGRRIGAMLVALGGLITWLVLSSQLNFDWLLSEAESSPTAETTSDAPISAPTNSTLASYVLEKLTIKGRSPKNTYNRSEFYKDWPKIDGCSLRQRIIKREFGETATLGDDNCSVISGSYTEPYTGAAVDYTEKSQFSSGIQIDHVVALSDAWQKGADNSHMDAETRYKLATDPLNLLAVGAKANQQKSDGDAATWLPSNKSFRCQYIARQISVKYKYSLWITQAEHDAMSEILKSCPNEPVIGIEVKE